MSQLLVRQVSPRLIKALKQRAAKAGRSAEAEHRIILESALARQTGHRDFKAFLLSMPAPGPLSVRRSKDRGRPIDV